MYQIVRQDEAAGTFTIAYLSLDSRETEHILENNTYNMAVPYLELVVVFPVNRLGFGGKPSRLDQHALSRFLHKIGIPDNIFPGH